MSAIAILLCIVALVAIYGTLRAEYRQQLLDDREEELEEYSKQLDERANRIAADEATLRSEFQALAQARLELDKWRRKDQ